LLVRAPGPEPAGAPGPKRIDALASLLDIAPTVAGLFGLPREACVRAGFRGRSLVAPDFAEGNERVLMTRSAGDPAAYAFRDRRMTLIAFPDGRAQLFDRQADPGEARDLATLETAALQQRLGTLAAHRETLERKPEPDDAQPSAKTQEALRALGYMR
jgi:arylsulfatase A-like enzyme